MGSETSIGGKARGFDPTLWTVVLRAKGNSREALEDLLQYYWKPVYFYIRRKGSRVEDAKDLAQGFFSRLLERNFLKNVSEEKGKFRSFLLAALENFLINEAEKARALKRGGGKQPLSIDFMSAEAEFSLEPVAKESLDQYFRRQWALSVLSRAMEALSQEMESPTFLAIKPHLTGGPAYEETAAKLGISKSDLNNLIHRTKGRYREHLRSTIAASVADPGLIEEELADLFESLK